MTTLKPNPKRVFDPYPDFQSLCLTHQLLAGGCLVTRYFYKPQPLRTLEDIRADILTLEQETKGLLGEILGLS